MTIEVIKYEEELQSEWEHFAHTSNNAGLVHCRRFLAHHGDRFQDLSLMFREKGRLVALLPAAMDETHSDTVVSHPGATFGGLVLPANAPVSSVVQLIGSALQTYRDWGFQTLEYRESPWIYHQKPFEVESWALRHFGPSPDEKLNSVIATVPMPQYSKRKRRNLRRGANLQVVQGDWSYLSSFFSMMKENLLQRHSVLPVHTLEQLEDLLHRLPEELDLLVALQESELVAGLVVFRSRNCWHVQYVGSTPRGRACGAVDVLVDQLVGAATRTGIPRVSLGVSDEPGTNTLNEGLFTFKQEFGSVVHPQRIWSLPTVSTGSRDKRGEDAQDGVLST